MPVSLETEFDVCGNLCGMLGSISKSQSDITLFSLNMTSTVNPESELQVTYEDQNKINRFASHNSKLEEIKEELISKEKELQNMEEAIKEMELLACVDDEGFQIMEGEIFVHFTAEEAVEWVTKKKEELSHEVEIMKVEVDRIKEEMNQLKTELYAKFGRNNINLEADD